VHVQHLRVTFHKYEVLDIQCQRGITKRNIFVYVVALLSHEFDVRLFAAPTVTVLHRQRTNVQRVKRYRLQYLQTTGTGKHDALLCIFTRFYNKYKMYETKRQCRMIVERAYR